MFHGRIKIVNLIDVEIMNDEKSKFWHKMPVMWLIKWNYDKIHKTCKWWKESWNYQLKLTKKIILMKFKV